MRVDVQYSACTAGDPSTVSLGKPQFWCVYMKLFCHQSERPIHALSWETSILAGPHSLVPTPCSLLPSPPPSLDPSSPSSHHPLDDRVKCLFPHTLLQKGSRLVLILHQKNIDWSFEGFFGSVVPTLLKQLFFGAVGGLGFTK